MPNKEPPSLAVAIEGLYNQCRHSGHCNVVFDPQAGSPFGEALAALSEELAPRAHLKDPIFADAPQEAPLLVRLPLSEWGLIEALAARAQNEAIDPENPLRSVCGFVRSAAPFERLASQLGRALSLTLPDNKSLYFRYFDPRVIHHLPHLLPAATRGKLLWGVETWSYFSWDGALVVQENPASSRSATTYTRITREEQEALETIEHFNATQRLFAKQGLPFDPAGTSELFAEVQAARTSSGLSSPDDMAYYLACSRLVGAPLSQNERWWHVSSAVNHGMPLDAVLAQVLGISLGAA